MKQRRLGAARIRVAAESIAGTDDDHDAAAEPGLLPATSDESAAAKLTHAVEPAAATLIQAEDSAAASDESPAATLTHAVDSTAAATAAGGRSGLRFMRYEPSPAALTGSRNCAYC